VIRKNWINEDFRVLGLSILGVSKEKKKEKDAVKKEQEFK
jgi:peroxiredoxin